MSTKSHTPVAVGIKYVKKARMWNFHVSFNAHDAPDINEYFITYEEAFTRLEKEQNG